MTPGTLIKTRLSRNYEFFIEASSKKARGFMLRLDSLTEEERLTRAGDANVGARACGPSTALSECDARGMHGHADWSHGMYTIISLVHVMTDCRYIQ